MIPPSACRPCPQHDRPSLAARPETSAGSYTTHRDTTALSEAPGVVDQSRASQEATLKAHAKLKRDDLATKVGEAFAETGYLPDLLVTPVPAGKFELADTSFAVAAE